MGGALVGAGRGFEVEAGERGEGGLADRADAAVGDETLVGGGEQRQRCGAERGAHEAGGERAGAQEQGDLGEVGRVDQHGRGGGDRRGEGGRVAAAVEEVDPDQVLARCARGDVPKDSLGRDEVALDELPGGAVPRARGGRISQAGAMDGDPRQRPGGQRRPRGREQSADGEAQAPGQRRVAGEGEAPGALAERGGAFEAAVVEQRDVHLEVQRGRRGARRRLTDGCPPAKLDGAAGGGPSVPRLLLRWRCGRAATPCSREGRPAATTRHAEAKRCPQVATRAPPGAKTAAFKFHRSTTLQNRRKRATRANVAARARTR